MTRDRRYLTPDEIRADFDRIARHEPQGSSPSFGRYAWIAEQLPPAPARALDLGCGTGALTRLLAARYGGALGVDLSAGMLEQALAATPADCPARFAQGDFRTTPAPGEKYDVVTAVAALHHLPIDDALAIATARVAPGGWLFVVDLHDTPHLPEPLERLAAWSLARWDALIDPRRVRAEGAREAWLAHGNKERLPSTTEIKRACTRLEPAGEPRFHVRWRWSLAWRAPQSACAEPPIRV